MYNKMLEGYNIVSDSEYQISVFRRSKQEAPSREAYSQCQGL